MSRPCTGQYVASSSASKKTLIASEPETQRVKDLRFADRLWSFTIDPRNLVFIDETGIHLGMTRLYGRAPIGERLDDSESPGDSGKNIVELRSESDSLETLQAKKQEYLENGARLGWLIDPKTQQVEICRPGQPVEVLDNPATLSGEDVLPGFVLDLQPIFRSL